MQYIHIINNIFDYLLYNLSLCILVAQKIPRGEIDSFYHIMHSRYSPLLIPPPPHPHLPNPPPLPIPPPLLCLVNICQTGFFFMSRNQFKLRGGGIFYHYTVKRQQFPHLVIITFITLVMILDLGFCNTFK